MNHPSSVNLGIVTDSSIKDIKKAINTAFNAIITPIWRLSSTGERIDYYNAPISIQYKCYYGIEFDPKVPLDTLITSKNKEYIFYINTDDLLILENIKCFASCLAFVGDAGIWYSCFMVCSGDNYTEEFLSHDILNIIIANTVKGYVYDYEFFTVIIADDKTSKQYLRNYLLSDNYKSS